MPPAVRRVSRSLIFDSFGDSITVGFYASNQATTAYIPVLEGLRGWDFTNHAIGGRTAVTHAEEIYGFDPTSNSISTYMLGTNDELFMTTADQRSDFGNIQIAEVAYLAIPQANKVLGLDTNAVAYSGTWSDTAQYGLGRKSAVQDSTATFTLTGTVLIFGFIGNDATQGSPSQLTITVDGVVHGPYTPWFLGTLPALVYAPYSVVITGLDNTAHTVVITRTSANGPHLWFDWAGGVTQADPLGAYVYVANVLRQTAAGYIANGGSDANVTAFNALIASNVSLLQSYGLNVELVDINAALNITTDLDADGIHPNDTGHGKLATTFSAAMNPTNTLVQHLKIPGGFAKVN